MQLLELRVQVHELPRHAVDAGVQVPVLAVLSVEVLLVALPPLRAADAGVRPEATEPTVRTATGCNCRTLCQRCTYRR